MTPKETKPYFERALERVATEKFVPTDTPFLQYLQSKLDVNRATRHGHW